MAAVCVKGLPQGNQSPGELVRRGGASPAKAELEPVAEVGSPELRESWSPYDHCVMSGRWASGVTATYPSGTSVSPSV